MITADVDPDLRGEDRQRAKRRLDSIGRDRAAERLIRGERLEGLTLMESGQPVSRRDLLGQNTTGKETPSGQKIEGSA